MPKYEKIEQIQIDNYQRGTFAGAAIFSADFDVGFSNKPTKFIINVVNPTGVYNVSDKDLSYINAHNIKFIKSLGIDAEGKEVEKDVISFRFYLESYQIQRAAGKRVLQLTFVDGSTLLDRVYVALGDRDRKIAESSAAIMPVGFPILCEAPDLHPANLDPMKFGNLAPNGLVDLSQKAIMPIKTSLFERDSIIRNAGKIEKGGMITVGWETPVIENFHTAGVEGRPSCSLVPFKYNFTHLLYMIEAFGIEVGGDFLKWVWDANLEKMVPARRSGVWGPSGLFASAADHGFEKIYNDRNPGHYESYGGQTLRQVLNTWCEQQAFSWYYSWESNGIVGVDENSPNAMVRFQEVSDIINTKQSQDAKGNREDVLIEQSTESATLAGTKRKYATTKVIRNAKPDNVTNYDKYRSIKFSPLDISHIIAPNQRGGITGGNNIFRDDTQFRISMSLGKFSKNAREIFNVACGAHEATGIKVLAEIDSTAHHAVNGMNNAAMRAIVLSCLATSPGASGGGQQLITTMNKWTQFWQIPFKVYFVKYDSKLKDSWEKWEDDLANTFLGKYYLNFDQLQNYERCDPGGRLQIRRKDETLPVSTLYSKEHVTSGVQAFKFNNILKGPYGLSIGVNKSLFQYLNEFNMMERPSPTWDTTQAEVDGILNAGNFKNDILKQWLPKFIPLKGKAAATNILSCFPHLNTPNVGGQLMGADVTTWANNMLIFQQGMSAHAIQNAILNQGNASLNTHNQEIGIYIHPDYSHPMFPFKISNVSYQQYENLKDIGYGQQNKQTEPYYDSCPLLCGGVSMRQKLCDDLNRFFESRPLPTGLERWNLGTFKKQYWTLPAFGFQIDYLFPPAFPGDIWATESVDIVNPTWTAYLGNHKMNLYRRQLDPKIQTIINQMEIPGQHPPGNVAGVEMITNDLSSQTSDSATGEIKISIPGGWGGKGFHPWDLSANFTNWTGKDLWDFIKLRDFHYDYVQSSIGNTNSLYAQPRKSISCTVAGMEYGSLAPFLNPYHGLESFSIRMGREGISSEIKFSNKPPKKVSDEVASIDIEAGILAGAGQHPMF